MKFFGNKKRGVPPHTWYPEILHWKEGDRINCWNIAQALSGEKFDWGTFKKYAGSNAGAGQYVFSFRSVDEQGIIYLEDENGELVSFHFYRFSKYARNETLKSRKLEQRVLESKEYMELMDNFQQAFNELQAADNHPKRLGEKSSD
ncbi:MAG: hypothetical protein JJ895_09285 [Balneolaceae bacterium]|nr:hypothetical protein [Balneolaceae bacterium]